MRIVFSLIPGIGFFIYLASTLDKLMLSSLLGVLALSIAIGSVGYFFFNAPEGKRAKETAFGITGKYRNPVHGTVIPGKTAVYIIGAIVLACVAGLGFNHYGY
jgi:hypothetical protein